MRRALLVKESNGYYDVNMTDEPCDWQDIIDQATSYRKVDDLQGWAPYTKAYRVRFDYGRFVEEQVYFVE